MLTRCSCGQSSKMCSSVSGYSFSFNPKVLGGRAIVLGFRVRVRVRVRVRIRIRELGDQNYEVGFETIGTVTQNYANFDYSGYFSFLILNRVPVTFVTDPELIRPSIPVMTHSLDQKVMTR